MKKYLTYGVAIFIVTLQTANAYVAKHSGGFSFDDFLQLIGIGLAVGGVIFFIGNWVNIKFIKDIGLGFLKLAGGSLAILLVMIILGFLSELF